MTLVIMAFVAKQDINHSILFIALESVVLLLQFGIDGVPIEIIHAESLEDVASGQIN